MDVLQKLKNTDSLTHSERVVADYLLEKGAAVGDLTLYALAQKTFTSNATVIRLCRKLGFNGYRDFQFELQYTLRKQTSGIGTVWLWGGGSAADAEAVSRRLRIDKIRQLPSLGADTPDWGVVDPRTDVVLLSPLAGDALVRRCPQMECLQKDGLLLLLLWEDQDMEMGR